MRQEVRVLLQLTLDVDTELSEKDIENKVNEILNNNLENFMESGIPVNMIDIIETREEAEIYGTEE